MKKLFQKKGRDIFTLRMDSKKIEKNFALRVLIAVLDTDIFHSSPYSANRVLKRIVVDEVRKENEKERESDRERERRRREKGEEREEKCEGECERKCGTEKRGTTYYSEFSEPNMQARVSKI